MGVTIQLKGTPAVAVMQVISVTGYDSMLISLSGRHAPIFARNIVPIKDSFGHMGIGKNPWR
jgi:glucarate dehydratase